MAGLSTLLTQEQIEAIDKHVDPARRRHPAWTAVFAEDRSRDYERKPKDYLTNGSAHTASQEQAGWLAGSIKRVAQTSDFEEAVSALAEIRAYGALREAGFEVDPIPTAKTPTPDFRGTLGKDSAIVEVQTKVEDKAQTKVSQDIEAGHTPRGVERHVHETERFRIDTVIRESQPFGAPNPDKAGDTTQTNAISRICAMKQKESQFEEGLPGILWLDFRDLGMWAEALEPDQAFPLMSWRGSLTSGAIWYAFYGWKGATVFEPDTPYRNLGTPMAHFGRFHPENPKKSRYSAAIICLSKSTILFENPCANASLPQGMRRAMLKLPWFDVSRSLADWSQGNVRQSIELSKSVIEAFN